MTLQQKRKAWARRIKSKRKGIKWSQETLARQSGFSLSYIQKIENAKDGWPEAVEKLVGILDAEKTA